MMSNSNLNLGRKRNVLMFSWFGHGHVSPFLQLEKNSFERIASTSTFVLLVLTLTLSHKLLKTSRLVSLNLTLLSLPGLPAELHTTMATLKRAFDNATLVAVAAKVVGIPSVLFITNSATMASNMFHLYKKKFLEIEAKGVKIKIVEGVENSSSIVLAKSLKEIEGGGAICQHLCAEDESLLGSDGASWQSHASSPWNTIPELHAMLKLAEKGIPKKTPAVLAIRQGQIQKPKSQARGKGKQRGKGKSKLAYDPKHKIPLPAKKSILLRTLSVTTVHKTGHWKRNCPLYLAELKKNKASASGTSGIFTIELFSFPKSNTWIYDTGCGTHICNTIQGLRGYRKLNKGALDLYVGNGYSATVEAIGSFELILPSGMILVLDNCHFSPSKTRGKLINPRLLDKGFNHKNFWIMGAISASKD
ncbi:hypothetical protein Tco_0536971 [Tanacetum coccineum]